MAMVRDIFIILYIRWNIPVRMADRMKLFAEVTDDVVR
jgi:hypothetical protein